MHSDSIDNFPISFTDIDYNRTEFYSRSRLSQVHRESLWSYSQEQNCIFLSFPFLYFIQHLLKFVILIIICDRASGHWGALEALTNIYRLLTGFNKNSKMPNLGSFITYQASNDKPSVARDCVTGCCDVVTEEVPSLCLVLLRCCSCYCPQHLR